MASAVFQYITDMRRRPALWWKETYAEPQVGHRPSNVRADRKPAWAGIELKATALVEGYWVIPGQFVDCAVLFCWHTRPRGPLPHSQASHMTKMTCNARKWKNPNHRRWSRLFPNLHIDVSVILSTLSFHPFANLFYITAIWHYRRVEHLCTGNFPPTGQR